MALSYGRNTLISQRRPLKKRRAAATAKETASTASPAEGENKFLFEN
jgi:hypothetical protein